jgi:hypothetical protein
VTRPALSAVLAAVVLTTLAAALAVAAGVELRIEDADEPIPVSGIAFMTAVLCLVGVALAWLMRRFASRPAPAFVGVSVVLTLLSLVPPLLYGDGAATAATLVVLHLLPAAVVVPVLARCLASADERVSA